nr:uncharacterized protein LOC110356877 isoform X5 [Columba livia]
MFVRNCYLVYWDGCILDTEVTGVTTEKQPLLYPQLSLCPSCLSGRPKAFIEMYFSSMPSKEVGLELSFYQVAEVFIHGSNPLNSDEQIPNNLKKSYATESK